MSPAPARRAARRTAPPAARIAPTEPHAHQVSVSTTIAEPAPQGQRVALPAWNPGSSMSREFARHVVALSARDARGALRVDKLDKHTWRVAPSPGPLTIVT